MKKILCIILIGICHQLMAQKTPEDIIIWKRPTNILLKSVDLSKAMTPVKHQGNRNTCNAFAATALVEYLIKIETGKTIDLSESYNYWASKNYTLTNDYLKKCYLHSDGLAGFLAVYAYKYGSMMEKEWPYINQNWFQLKDPRCKIINGIPSPECFTETLPVGAKILQYRVKPIFIKKEDIGAYILVEKKPVVMNIAWFPKTVGSHGDIHMPKEEEKAPEYGHVILLVGYNKTFKQFTFRNSWGNRWGRNGYGTLPEKYILQHYELAKFEPIDQYPPTIKAFCQKGKMGVSGILYLNK